MSAYKRMKVSDLQRVCEARGVDYIGLNKRGLLAALRRKDEEEERNGQMEGNGEQSEVFDDEVTFRSVDEPLGDGGSIAGSEADVNVENGCIEPESVSLMRLKLALVKEERQRERERDERSQQMREREWEIERARAELNAGQTSTMARPAVRGDLYHILPKMTDGDPLVFFSAFERALLINGVEKAEWPKFLAACLTVKANKVLAGLSLAENQDFDKCKQAILSYFRLDAPAYQKRFREARKAPEETHKMFKTRIQDCFSYYLEAKGISSLDELVDDVISEQLLSVFTPEVKHFVLSKQPNNADECCSYADLYGEMARTTGLPQAQGNAQNSGVTQSNRKSVPAANVQASQNVSNGVYKPNGNRVNGGNMGALKGLRCYICNAPGHKRHECPNQNKPGAGVCSNCQLFHPYHVPCNARAQSGVYAAAASDMVDEHVSECGLNSQNLFQVPVVINGVNALAIRDTGCQMIAIVHPRFVRDCDYTGESLHCRGAFDDVSVNHRVRLANITLFAPNLNCDQQIRVKVGVWPLPDNLDCLLGNALFTENSMLQDVVGKNVWPNQNGVRGSFERGKSYRPNSNHNSVRQGLRGCKLPIRDLDRNAHLAGQGDSNNLFNQTLDRPTGDSETVHGDAHMSCETTAVSDLTENISHLDVLDGRPKSTLSDMTDPVQTETATGPAKTETVSQGYRSDGERPDQTASALVTGNGTDYDKRPAGGASRQTDDCNAPLTGETPTQNERNQMPGETVKVNGVSETQAEMGDLTVMENLSGNDSSLDGARTAPSSDITAEVVRRVTTRAAAATSSGLTEVERSDRHSPGGSGDDAEASTAKTGRLTRRCSAEFLTGDTDKVIPGMDANAETETIRDFNNIDISDIDLTQTETIGEGETERAREFRQSQGADSGLQSYWTRAAAGSADFCIINGLLYKRALTGGYVTDSGYLLVIPESHEREIIRMAHDSLLGAHLGVNKTAQRIGSQFFFPKMKKKVSTYVKCCHQCQMVRGSKVSERQPLQPIEVIDQLPFQSLTIDFLGGQLPTTARKNRYVLTVVCNATGWIEAIPMKNCRAESVADELLKFFCDKGFPTTITSDNMSSFKSEVLTAVREKLGIGAKFSAPYHPQSHGRVERANRTIGEMLKRFIFDYPADWDRMLPFLCFALREVPNASSQYSAFELVYGRKARGLLAVVREELEGGDVSQKLLKMPAARYVEKLGERIRVALETAAGNTRESQQKNKANYDKQSTVRCLEPGESALILMPSHGNKLLSRWCGPYRVLKRCPDNNYILDVNGREALLHMNALRKYETEPDAPQIDADGEKTGRPQTITVPIVISGERDAKEEAAGEASDQAKQTGGDDQFTIGNQLSPGQRDAIKTLLAGYADLFTAEPGCTHLAQHTISVTDSKQPCYQPSYRVPDALRGEVERELSDMERRGIIKYDPHATWNSPLVIVRKGNGGLRLCNNFIQLNKRTVAEPYIMTNTTELLNKVAGAKFITRLDMRAAYWQVPLHPDSQKFTSFQTPFGVYSYLRMPMGLVNSSATLQRLMDRILRGAHDYADKLLDDILIWTDDFDLHLTQLADVLNRLRCAGLTLNAAKCHLATDKIKIFGFLVDNGKITPDAEKTKAVVDWPIPKTKKQLKSFVGLVNYFRSHIANYAEIAFPLSELLGRYKPDKLKWGEEQQAAFDTLKKALVSKPVLYPPDKNKDFQIMADSSQTTLSAILLQSGDGEDKTPRVISYASRKLLPRERNYPTIERELLSIVFALAKFHFFRVWEENTGEI